MPNNDTKKQGAGSPAGGYCLQRTRRRLARLLWALFYLAVGLGAGALFIRELLADKSGWDYMDYIVLAISGGLCLGGLAAAVYEGYTNLRDFLFPAKSRLARSIRSQLPYPEEALDVRELFAMVDDDIREHGQWFDRVAVGKRWIFGDDVSAIERVRIVFGRDEMIRRHVNGRTQIARIVELCIMDDRHQVQRTGLRDARKLKPLLECIQLRCPDVPVLNYEDSFTDYNTMDEEEWQQVLRDFRLQKSQRERSRQTDL